MIRVELRKQLPRVRTWVALLVVAVVPVVMTIGFAVGGPPEHARNEGGPAFAELATQSGLNLPLFALSAMQRFLLVVVVALFAGETLPGEASWGTLRYLLVRPVDRARLLTAKLSVASLLTVLATVLVPVFALAAAVPAFGWHPVSTVFGPTIMQGEALTRIFESAGYIAWGFAGTVAFAFFVATMVDSAFGAVFAGLAFAMVSQILDAIPAFGSVRYGLPTHYWDAWNALFAPFGNTSDMWRGALVQVPYAVVFVVAAFWWFRRKDVLS